jgi:hypothetical protein
MTAWEPPPRLTKAEIRSIVRYYNSKLPQFEVLGHDMLVRSDGPVVQGISFERMSAGAYRPTPHVRVMVAPENVWCFELSEPLSIKFRVTERLHDTSSHRDQVVAAMMAEVVPRLDQPLRAENVLELYERMAVPNFSQAYSLAALNAYLGRDLRALFWCDEYIRLVEGNPFGWYDEVVRMRDYLSQLREWIRAGESRRQLDRVLEAERLKWGLTALKTS